MKKIKGFTLIELLIVISIIGVLTALLATNFVAARNRALDSKAKTNLQQLKNALHSYYASYHKYPDNNDTALGSPLFKGCGATGTTACSSSAPFAANGIEYLSKLPTSYNYYSCAGGDDFRLKITLSNKSDSDITQSKLLCPATTCAGVSAASLNYTQPTKYEYILCGSQ